MQIVINARGRELAIAWRKKAPGPHVLVSQSNNINVHDVQALMAFQESRPGN